MSYQECDNINPEGREKKGEQARACARARSAGAETAADDNARQRLAAAAAARARHAATPRAQEAAAAGHDRAGAG